MEKRKKREFLSRVKVRRVTCSRLLRGMREREKERERERESQVIH
jgi:hypothetical protein